MRECREVVETVSGPTYGNRYAFTFSNCVCNSSYRQREDGAKATQRRMERTFTHSDKGKSPMIFQDDDIKPKVFHKLWVEREDNGIGKAFCVT